MINELNQLPLCHIKLLHVLLLMMTSSNGNVFRVTGLLCGEFTGHWWIPAQRPVTRGFEVFFDLRLKQQSIKQGRHLWFEKPSRSLWRHCNVKISNTSQPWEDTLPIFKIQIWLPDFIVGLNRFRNLTAWPVWTEVTCHIRNKTKNLFTYRQAVKILNKCLIKIGNNATEIWEYMQKVITLQ